MDKHNTSIGCSVDECSYHCKNDNYCTLNQIEVGKDCNLTAKTPSVTQCSSFKSDSSTNIK